MLNNILAAFNYSTVMQSLDLLWKGMLAIFIAIGAIYLVVLAMLLIGKKVKQKREELAKLKIEQPSSTENNSDTNQ